MKNDLFPRNNVTYNQHSRKPSYTAFKSQGEDASSELIEYPQHLHLPVEYIRSKISEFLTEDMPDGDVTTDIIIPEEQRTALLRRRRSKRRS